MEKNKLTDKKSEFRKGDKILFQQEGRQEILTLRHITLPKGHEGKAWKIKEASGWLGEEQFRHATDEEVYWLETLDRSSVSDFREGDVLIDSNFETLLIDSKIRQDFAETLYANGNFKGIYPASSFKPFHKGDAK